MAKKRKPAAVVARSLPVQKRGPQTYLDSLKDADRKWVVEFVAAIAAKPHRDRPGSGDMLQAIVDAHIPPPGERTLRKLINGR